MILAIDTSNYTTSICLLDKEGIVHETRELIKVKEGQKGIRQSDAFYQHMQVLHHFVKHDLPAYASQITAIGVSTKPRPVLDSYMPVFNAGTIIANTIQASIGCQLFELSHQEGHLEAALATSSLKENEFVFLHLSGGTTELHFVDYSMELPRFVPMLETADISIGQLVDRIGVKAGLKFPCGAEMDRRSKEGSILKEMPPFRVAKQFNLSGYENFYSQLLKEFPDKEDEVFYNLFCGLESILRKMIIFAVKETKVKHVLLAGGVAASRTLRKLLEQDKKLAGIQLVFSDPNYASDNAYGTAKLAEKLMENRSL